MSPSELANHLDHIEGQCRAIADHLSQLNSHLANLRHAIADHLSQLNSHLANLRHGAESPPAFHNVIHNLPTGKMDCNVFFDVIASQIDAYIENRGRYSIKDFREHCEPLLEKHFHQQDLEASDKGTPKWFDRFSCAHRPIAERRGYIHSSGGVYVMLST